jgi:hypothetical protein
MPLPRPMPDSLSQRNRRGTWPSRCSNTHIPGSRSSVRLVGIIRPRMNREYAHVITSTGRSAMLPSSSGIFRGGNHRSHCAASPGDQVNRSDGSTGRFSGRSRRTLSRNHVIDPVHPTRSAITVAGLPGWSLSICRTRDSNGVNDVGTAGRSYFGGRSEANARSTSTCRSPDPVRPDAAAHRPRPVAGSEPNPPLRSPIQSVWVASSSTVDGLIFERRRHRP